MDLVPACNVEVLRVVLVAQYEQCIEIVVTGPDGLTSLSCCIISCAIWIMISRNVPLLCAKD